MIMIEAMSTVKKRVSLSDSKVGMKLDLNLGMRMGLGEVKQRGIWLV